MTKEEKKLCKTIIKDSLLVMKKICYQWIDDDSIDMDKSGPEEVLAQSLGALSMVIYGKAFNITIEERGEKK